MSSPLPLPLLEAQDFASGDITPTSAFVHVTLTADHFFSATAAFAKAEELRRLASGLAQLGIPESALSLAGASVDVSSGVFTKSSSVTYRVRILIENLDLVAHVLDAVAEAKRATLTHIEWNYDGGTAQTNALLREAGERARTKARVLAESVGAVLGAIHSVREVVDSELSVQFPGPSGVAMMRRGSSVAEQLSGLELAPKKRVTVRVAVQFTLPT